MRSALAAAGVLALATSGAPAGPRNDIAYSTEVVTPHVAWAAKLPAGPLKGFFIPSVAHGRDMVELMQRLALDATTVSIDRNWDVNCWGIGDFYGHEFRGDINDFQTVYRYVEEDLTSDKPFEVLLIPGLNGWSRLTRASRDAILRRVSAGAGLVLIHPFVGDVKGRPFKGDETAGDERLWEVSPLVGVPDDFVSERGYPELNTAAIAQGKWTRAKSHYITDGVPLELIPAGRSGGRFYKYEANGQVLIESGGQPILATKSYGKGRVVALAYVEDGFLPEAVNPIETKTYWDYWEYEYSLLVRSLLWASGRASPLRIEGGVRIAGSAQDPAGSVETRLVSPQARAVDVEVAVRSEWGGVLGRSRERRSLPAGTSVVDLKPAVPRPAGGWPGGRSIVDVIVRDAESGASLDFASATFETPRRATVTGLRPNASVYHRGDTMSLVTRAAGQLEGLKMRLEVRDDLGRLLHVEEKATPGEKYFFYALDDFLGKRAVLSASLVDAAGQLVDQLRAAPVVVVQAERRQKEYQALLSFEEPRHDLAALRQRRLHALGMDSGFTWGGEVNDSLDVPRGYFGVYWYDRGPTTPEGLERAVREYQATGDGSALQYLTRKELFRRTGDKKFLTRSPSLDDPEVLRRLADVSRTAARNKAVYNMNYYFVGDEGSLTSYTDPVDFDFGPHTLANFRAWLRGEYGSLEALNRSWKSDHEDWNAVTPETTDEVRKSGVFPRWADHRTYMEVSFANAYRVVRDAVTQADPQGHIALSGTQVTTPYNGCDWYRLDKVIDDFLSYDGGNQWDLHRSFAKPGARVGFWTGYGRSGIGVQHEIWSAALSGVLFPNLFWSYSVVNPDLTFSRSGRDMGRVFQALRFEGVGRLLMEAERLGDGIAVHYSMASVHAAGILGLHAKDDDEPKEADTPREPNLPRDRDGWARGLSDLGFSYEFVSYDQVAKDGLDPTRLRVFVLPLSLAMSSNEVHAIEAFVRAGGIVVADGAPGLMDEHCAWRPQGMLNELFGIGAASSSQRAQTQAPRLGPVVATPEGITWGLESGELQGLSGWESGIVAKGSAPLLRIGATPAVFVRRVGRGWTVYLNVLLDRYPSLRANAYGGEAYRTLLKAVLGHLGVHPTVELADGKGRPVGPARIARYRLGGADVVAVLLEPIEVEKAYGRDGVTVYDDSSLGKVVRREIEVRLPRAGGVTNVRTGESLGRTDRVKLPVVAGDALFLAVGSPRGTLDVEGPATARPGERPRFSLRSSAPGQRLVRAQVFGPDGTSVPEYARTLLVAGERATFVLPLALDDPPGKYRLRFADVLSGDSVEAGLEAR